ncbi:Lrp/AsnC family transcriptional regulator [Candidatus Woesearchaeota archaeon]|nr:Lrp/AsnC family transcriptional regulator [Candidatus Woesearchaeota archaeon]
MKKLDLKDKKLLAELDLNSRATLAGLARRIPVSKQVVDYRLKNLVKNKIISQFYAVINFSKLGYTQHKLYFKFQNADVEKEREIVAYWAKSRNAIWVASCRGRWDLAVSLLAKDSNELGALLSAFLEKYGALVLEKDALITQTSHVFTKGSKEKKRFVYGSGLGHYALDEIDQKILRMLSTQARVSILEMMAALNLTRDVIAYRMKKLVKEEIISQFRVLANMGHRLYKIMLRLHSLTPEKERQLVTYVALHPDGVQYLKLIGSWDAEVEFEVRDDEHLHEILLGMRNTFSGLIRDYDLLFIHEEHKLNYYPF